MRSLTLQDREAEEKGVDRVGGVSVEIAEENLLGRTPRTTRQSNLGLDLAAGAIGDDLLGNRNLGDGPGTAMAAEPAPDPAGALGEISKETGDTAPLPLPEAAGDLGDIKRPIGDSAPLPAPDPTGDFGAIERFTGDTLAEPAPLATGVLTASTKEIGETAVPDTSLASGANTSIWNVFGETAADPAPDPTGVTMAT